MRKIEAKIVADSVDGRGNRITSFILTYPRFIHPELMTHRMFSRNSASSRAIPFEKMVQSVQEDPFIPIAWQKDHKGMQGTEYAEETKYIRAEWLIARDQAVQHARRLNSTHEITKQICNRLLEPFLWHTVLVTATEYENFFQLRCPKYMYKGREFKSRKDLLTANLGTFPKRLTDIEWLQLSQSGAEIHIQALAEAMWDAYNESKPTELKAGEWHIPFGDKIDDRELAFAENLDINEDTDNQLRQRLSRQKISIARCARLSYMTFEGEINYKKDLDLHDHLFASHHMSPFEHCARMMDDNEYENMFQMTLPQKNHRNYFVDHHQGWCRNFRGFIPYRFLIEQQNGRL